MWRPSYWILCGLLATLGVLAGCKSDDDSNGVTTGTLTGRVVFHGEWPDSGAVQLSVFDSWNPALGSCSWCPDAAGGPPDYYTTRGYFADPNPNNGAGPDTVAFTISGITLGTYQAVAMGWRAPVVRSVACDEPVIGLYGADPFTTDSLPAPVTFTEADPEVTDLIVHAYFTLPPALGCDATGSISGTVRVNTPWPPEGLLVLVSSYPFTPWLPPTQAPAGYVPLPTPADTAFTLSHLPLGTYYVSLWTNIPPPQQPAWFGAYGVPIAGDDARPDPVRINSIDSAATGVVITGVSPPPHWISGTVNFTGSRPAEGLLVLFSTFPFTPEHPPQGAPSAYFQITDPSETLYAQTGLPEGTYYVSLWSNTPPPGQPVFYGAYGYTAGSDIDPDPVVIGATLTTWGVNSINIAGQP